MVNGIELFGQYFKNYQSDYILIGGVACELVLDSLRLKFRPTDDFDIVVVSKNLKTGFGLALKDFIRDGGYTVQHRKSNNRPSFFRFVKPANEDFPAKLELASDKPAEDWIYDFTALDTGDEKSSLSAIIFETDYYNFICSNTTVIKGITTIILEGLIPLKALTYSELSKIENPSEKIRINIAKHAGDIFNLAEALSNERFELPAKIAANLIESLNAIEAHGISEERLELLAHISEFYQLVS